MKNTILIIALIVILLVPLSLVLICKPKVTPRAITQSSVSVIETKPIIEVAPVKPAVTEAPQPLPPTKPVETPEVITPPVVTPPPAPIEEPKKIEIPTKIEEPKVETKEPITTGSGLGVRPHDFIYQEYSGKEVKFHSLFGRKIILNFAATWCAPCKEELPALISFASKNPDILVMILMQDDDYATAQKLYDDSSKNVYIDGLTKTDKDGHVIIPNLVIVMESKDVIDRYGIIGIPVTYLVNEEGITKRVKIGRFIDYNELDYWIKN